MIKKDLTILKWRKSIYYVSNNIIFEITNKRKKQDLDECTTYLIDITPFSEFPDGMSIDVKDYPETFKDYIPHIYLKFESDSAVIERYIPLQYLIEEGDKIIEGKAIQKHPDIYGEKYISKFNNEIYNYIRDIIKNESDFDPKNVQLVLNALPEWLTADSDFAPMTESYIDKYFLRGRQYKNRETGEYKLTFCGLGIAGEYSPVNIWNKETIEELLKAIYAERIINKYNASMGLSKSAMEETAKAIKEAQKGSETLSLKTFLNIEEGITFESVCAEDNINTWEEYQNSIIDYSKCYDYIHDEESWNESYANGGLKKYYEWSDKVNAPYKEDLWNTVESRAANINDARKDPETGEYILDENGNYIYDNCERCWLGAVKAPGAKYPWIVPYFEDDVNSKIAFRYEGKEDVMPWGDKVFGIGKKEDGSDRLFGAASVASEFGDNDFLISENRNDGGESTFDIEKFEMVLIPA